MSTSHWRISSCWSMMILIWRSRTTTTLHRPPPTPCSKRFRCGRLRGAWAFGQIQRRTVSPISVRSRIPVWIVNSRNTADEDAVRTLAALAGFTPRITHQIDSLDLVEDLILDGHGVGLLPVNRPLRDGLAILRLSDPTVILTAYAVIRRGRSNWPPLRAILDRLRPQSPSLPQEDWPRPTAHPSAPTSTSRTDNTQLRPEDHHLGSGVG
jgi:hypothetical protein